jgi:imidazolonepropionase-like amidohydrolase
MIRIYLRLTALGAGTLLALATLALPPSEAQAPATGASVALTNVRIIDGTGRPAIERGTLVMGSGRITAVGPAASTQIPAGAQRIDLAGKTIVPGFINAHAHLNVDRGATLPVRDDLVRRLKIYALYGVTSTVSLGSTQADELEGFKLMQEQDRVGLDRARLYTAGLNAIGKTPEEARASVDRLADLHAQLIKFHINGNPNDMNRPTWSAIIDESHKKGLKASVHIFYHKDAEASVDDGVDILAHSIRDQDVTPGLIAKMKQKNVAYIPTLTRDLSVFVYETTPDFLNEPFFQRGMSLYKEQVSLVSSAEFHDKVKKDPNTEVIRKALGEANKNLKTLSDAGITIAMGTDSGVAGAGNVGRWQGYFEQVEMEMMNKAGMSPMKVIVASTGDGAKVMGLKNVGTLQPGNWADLVVLRANPLDNIRNTRMIDSVWIAGGKLADVTPVTSTK